MTSTGDSDPPVVRHVRSFVRRGGRLTTAQGQALENLWPRFGIDGDEPLQLARVFGREAPRALEIGFGMGDALAAMAQAHPEQDYLGIDVHEAGIGRVLRLIDDGGLSNVRIIRGDAMLVLRDRIADDALDTVFVFFPDPWPKKRHHKRRIVRPALLDVLARCLKPGGEWHLATDWESYAQQMLEVIEADDRFRNLSGAGRFCADKGERPVTRFEQRGERLGHDIFDLRFERVR